MEVVEEEDPPLGAPNRYVVMEIRTEFGPPPPRGGAGWAPQSLL